jgi:hypothetical protein
MTDRPPLRLVVSNDEPGPLNFAVTRAQQACTCGGAGHKATCRYWDVLPKRRRPKGIDHARVAMGFPPCTG